MIGKKWHWHWLSFTLRWMARTQGFLDPVGLFSNLQRFSKPSEVWAPSELLRSGAILHARGLINSQAIQHNLDWVWPYWVERQFTPTNESFIPRAFSATHINLTHRNWTAVGLPDFDEFPIVDPRGLVTPLFDGWSVDVLILREDKKHLIPSRLEKAKQEILFEGMLAIQTTCENAGASLVSRTEVVSEDGVPFCRMTLNALSNAKAWLAVTVRPYNPEGISFIHSIRPLATGEGWRINEKQEVRLSRAASRLLFSDYSTGDVLLQAFPGTDKTAAAWANAKEAMCDVGMATAAALYELKPNEKQELEVRVPVLSQAKVKTPPISPGTWEGALVNSCRMQIPDKQFQFLFEAALRTLVLHSPDDVYPGPYTYRRFWFRDAAFILNAMLCAGLSHRVEKVLDRFPSRQTPLGYFLSQDGEWDSNGEALWILYRYCILTHQTPKAAWLHAISSGGKWIQRKRTSQEKKSIHAGLLPAGFSAEHLGPNDFYYWDDFWGIAGLQSAAGLMKALGEQKLSEEFTRDAWDLSRCVDESLVEVKKRLGHDAMPASASRRMDAGAIGSVAVGYPLQLWKSDDPRLLATANYLLGRHFLGGGVYHEISHSEINAYLTLHVAQVLMRAGDVRYFDLAAAIASLATSTGQWPEAIHPRTQGGCMGDGQHVWAAAEWVLLMRHLFVREEESENRLVLCAGILKNWLKKGEELFFGPTLTVFGEIRVKIICGETIRISWDARWHQTPPMIEIHFPGTDPILVPQGELFFEIKSGEAA